MTAPKPVRSSCSGASLAKRLRLVDLRRRQAACGGERPDAVHELRVDLIAPGDAVGEIRREQRAAAVAAKKVAEQGDAHLVQRAVMQVVPAPDPA